MDIKDFKDLEKLLKICRKQGITEFSLGSFSCKLGDLPLATSNASSALSDDLSESPYSNFPDGTLSPEQLMFYSSGGMPENDPYREDN